MRNGAHDRQWDRGGRALALVAALLLVAGVLTVPTAAQAAPGDVGVEAFSHAGTSTPTGTKRAESVLWFNDGLWWGNLWDTRTGDFHIFRFDATARTWVDTGVTTETRANTHHDVLWDGTTLSIASHMFVSDGVAAVSGTPSTLRQYSYNTSTNTYALRSPSTQINNMRTESLVIDKDTQGQLWATWQQGNQIFVNNTETDGRTWGTPFALPGGAVSQDDTAGLIAFRGRMGIMWSRQTGSSSDGFYWSVHVDGASRTSWSAPVGAATGTEVGDDHLNLKWLDASGGRVFAAVKTSLDSATQPLLLLLAMDSTGSWSRSTIATVSECPNRVILLIDERAQLLRAFATYPKPSGTTNAGACTSSGGAIYEKSTPLNNINFTAKTARIVDADRYVHNVSSTKQNLNNSRTDGASTTNSGLMIMADVNATLTYWYHYESGGDAPPPADTTPPDTTITAGPSGTVTATDATFEFAASENGSTFECRLDSAAFAPCTSPKTYDGLATGSHTFEVRATDGSDNEDPTPATRSWTIGTVPIPTGGIARSSFSSATTAAAGDLSIPKPSGVVAGDVLVSCVALTGGSISAAPTGWTLMPGTPPAVSNPRVYGYYKVASGAEPTDYRWTASSAGGGAIARYSGALGLDTTVVPASGAAAASGTVGQVTTTTANAMLVGCMGVNSGSVTLSSPSGMAEVAETGARRFELADGLQPTAGPSGAKTWTFSSSREWGGWLLALRPR
jgi:hypothetical protein